MADDGGSARIGEVPLPSPDEANRIAFVTGRLVAASDGRYYSGEEEVLRVERSHSEADSLVDAINDIADYPSDPSTWLAQVASHRLEYLGAGSIDLAIDWLTELRRRLWESRLRPGSRRSAGHALDRDRPVRAGHGQPAMRPPAAALTPSCPIGDASHQTRTTGPASM